MPLSHETLLYAVEDCKIAKVTSDPAGGATVYATSVDVPGIKSVEVEFEITSQELRGDNTRITKRAALTGVRFNVAHAKVSLDVLAILLGGVVADSGTTPNMKASYSRGSTAATDILNHFRFEARTPASGVDTIGGDAHMIFFKCMLEEFGSFGLAEEGFQEIQFSASSEPPIGTPANRWFELPLNETLVAIA